MLDRTDPPIYLSQISINDINETLAWSSPAKARGYISDRVPGDVNWDSELSSDDIEIAIVNGEIVARVERVPIADPASLTASIENWPSPRSVFDTQPIVDQ